MTTVSGRWSDLRARVLSAIFLACVGGAAIWIGGTVIEILSLVLCSVMLWELASMCSPGRVVNAYISAIVAFIALLIAFELRSSFPPSLALLLICPVGLAFFATRMRGVFAVYGFAIMLTGYGFVALREGLGAHGGLLTILWIMSVVIISDVAGYFAGRTFGGPKFWPAISPKKTWSGTVAGWIGALVIGAGFSIIEGGWGLMFLSPFVAFAGQMGDIAESWIKRQAGAKDSSNLIPGHGGVLDRFDSVIAAVLVVLLVLQIEPLPLIGG